MNTSVKRILFLAVSSVAVALIGGGVIAQQVPPEAVDPSFPVPPPPSANPQVSEPEPAPNPVRERRDQQRQDNNESAAGGIDPELGPIAEPDADDVAPALRVKGEGDWQRPKDDVRDRVRRETIERAAKISDEMNRAAGAGTSASQRTVVPGQTGLIMPRLMAPNIPLVPMELLFPPEVVSAGPPPVRQSRGSAIIIGALDREAKSNSRIRIPSGGEGTYGSLRVKVSGCFMSNPEDTTESWAYVEVSDMGRTDRKQLAVLPQRDRSRVRAATGERVLRKGWIIASSPSVTPIDHPVYDMWLVTCEGDGGAGPQPQWPGGIAPPGQEGTLPPAVPGTAAAGAPVAPAPAPTVPPPGKQTGN
jgi:hypothetical protein